MFQHDYLHIRCFHEAHDLSVDESAGVKAPDSENTWMVKSYSSERLHYVKMSDFGGIICDDQRLSYL